MIIVHPPFPSVISIYILYIYVIRFNNIIYKDYITTSFINFIQNVAYGAYLGHGFLNGGPIDGQS